MSYQTTYSQYQPTGFAGMMADMTGWNGLTAIASANIAIGAPVQRNGDTGCSPLVSGGEFTGVAGGRHLVTGNGDIYAAGDNVPVIDEGIFYAVADAAITAGVALNWNTATGRYTTAATSGTVIACPQLEAQTSASGAGATFKARLRRIPS
jgi:hypothetical protein